ncbi:MAG: DUF2252 family protein, partial [Phycisphaerae bacterium]|nr:DUF2252 family protein [Phycisphaerae bacterium]
WRGSKEHFYVWAKAACADWLADRSRFIPTHGDPHFGNIGSYPSECGFGSLAIGLVDFDEASLLPPEFDLLQGWIMIRLTAGKMKLPWTPRLSRAVGQTILQHYRAAAESGMTATQLLSQNELAQDLMDESGMRYRKELRDLTEDGRFRKIIGKASAPSDILRPTDSPTVEKLARGLAEAAASQPQLGMRLRYSSAESLKASIRDLALRTRLKSSGSQGLRKLYVLMRTPLADIDHDAVLYLKEQVLTPAERMGVAPLSQHPPARRAADFASALCEPEPFLHGWLEIDGRSYLLSLREPWSTELDISAFRGRDDLLAAVEIWAVVVGCAHRQAGMSSASWLTDSTLATIESRAEQYLALHSRAYEDFISDPRTTTASAAAGEALLRVAGITIP